VSLAQDKEYFQACFAHAKNAIHAFNSIQFIKAEQDKIQRSAECLEFYISKQRTKLYQRYLKTKYQGYYTLSSHASMATQSASLCKLDVTKYVKTKNIKSAILLSKRSNLHAENQFATSTEVSSLIISHGETGTIRANESTYNITCKVLPIGYNLKIDLSGPNTQLSTSRFIQKGSTIDLGSISQDSNNKNNSYNIKKSIGLKKDKLRKRIQITITAK